MGRGANGMGIGRRPVAPGYIPGVVGGPARPVHPRVAAEALASHVPQGGRAVVGLGEVVRGGVDGASIRDRETVGVRYHASAADASARVITRVKDVVTIRNPETMKVLDVVELCVAPPDGVKYPGKEKQKRVWEVTLSTTVAYKVGDAVNLFAPSDPAQVAAFLEVAGLRAEEKVAVSKSPDPISLEEALTKHYEVHHVTADFMRAALPHIVDDAEKAKWTGLLGQLESAEAQKRSALDLDKAEATRAQALKDGSKMVTTANRLLRKALSETTYVDILTRNPGAKALFQGENFGLELLKQNKVRAYTIAGIEAPVGSQPGQVRLMIAAVDWAAKEKGQDIRVKGRATGHLGTLQPGQEIKGFPLRKNFTMPPVAQDLVLVTNGAGLALTMSVLQEREKQVEQASGGSLISGKVYVFHGVPTETYDFADNKYQKQIAAWKKSGVITELYLAVSREDIAEDDLGIPFMAIAGGRMYVQVRVRQHGALIWSLMQGPKKAMFIYCGGGEVSEAMAQILPVLGVEEGGVDNVASAKAVEDLEKEGLIVDDTY